MELENFQNFVVVECQRAEERLMNSWYPGVIALFSSESRSKWSNPHLRTESFYECVATLIGNNIRYGELSVEVLMKALRDVRERLG